MLPAGCPACPIPGYPRRAGSRRSPGRTRAVRLPSENRSAVTQYIVRRLLLLPLVLPGVSVLVFLVLHLVPGNPAQVIAGPDAPPETVRQIEIELGLDKPLAEQYVIYLG